jgi:hypothetical protein
MHLIPYSNAVVTKNNPEAAGAGRSVGLQAFSLLPVGRQVSTAKVSDLFFLADSNGPDDPSALYSNSQHVEHRKTLPVAPEPKKFLGNFQMSIQQQTGHYARRHLMK